MGKIIGSMSIVFPVLVSTDQPLPGAWDVQAAKSLKHSLFTSLGTEQIRIPAAKW